MLTQSQRQAFLETLSEPRYMDKEHKGSILLYGKLGEERISFWASPNDSMDYGREIYWKALRGDYGEIADGPYNEVEAKEQTGDLSPEQASDAAVEVAQLERIKPDKDLF